LEGCAYTNIDSWNNRAPGADRLKVIYPGGRYPDLPLNVFGRLDQLNSTEKHLRKLAQEFRRRIRQAL